MDIGFRRCRYAARRTLHALTLCLAHGPGAAQEGGLPPVSPDLGELSGDQVSHYRDAVGNLLPVPPSLIRDFQHRQLETRKAAADGRRARRT